MTSISSSEGFCRFALTLFAVLAIHCSAPLQNCVDGARCDTDGATNDSTTAHDASTRDDSVDVMDASMNDASIEAAVPDVSTVDSATTDASSCPAPVIAATGARGSNAPVYVRTSYDYVPTVMLDGVYRMWWCGGIAGDYVLYAEASSLDGPWHAHGSSVTGSHDVAFQPTGNPADFDGVHTCDPSVVRVDGTYYLYYGGLGGAGSIGTTAIGVATSADGYHFSRLNGGRAIVQPARDYHTVPNQYGAGQPSVAYVDGYYYLTFTDSTGRGANPVNGAGQFVLRSQDPVFQSGVEELTATGFTPYSAATHTQHSLTEAFSVDWQYVDTIDAFAMAVDGASGVTQIRLFDRALLHQTAMIEVPGNWTEGPGIVSRPDKHAVPSISCGTVPIDLMRSVGPGGPDTWDLAHDGIDMSTGQRCDCTPLSRVFEGSLFSVPGLPLTLIRQGLRLQFALSAPASRLARNSFGVSAAIFNAIPFGASMHMGDEVIGAPGRPAAFHLDGRAWPASCLELITDNGSSITSVSVAAFDAIPAGPSLYCLR